jgi:glucosamine-6-phosphate deaminase
MSLSVLENEKIFVLPTYLALCEAVATRIAELVAEKPNAVLGLATGSTPLGVYAALVRRHREDGLDFSGITCFNLDEYYPMLADNPHSYYAFMQANLFQFLNGPRWHIPSGRLRSPSDLEAECRRYEEAIVNAGGIDLQLLGIGRTGHVGFNEPGSSAASRTRLVTLHSTTREDAAAEFGSLDQVPRQAVSMGMGTILEAREIVLMASGSGKAQIVLEALTGKITERLPASLICQHHHAQFCFDADAAHLLLAK